MTIPKLLIAPLLLAALMASSSANAWFIFIPGGLIEKLLSTDPASIEVSDSDRSLGMCAGYHVNQAEMFKLPEDVNSGGFERAQSPETEFHSKIADLAAEQSSAKAKVRDLAFAYSGQWKRVASAGIDANRSFGRDLAGNCVRNELPFRLADYPRWQAQQEERKQVKVVEPVVRPVQPAALGTQAPAQQQSLTPQPIPVVAPQSIAQTPPNSSPSTTGQIDFTSEAKKSARILGCATQDVRVVGVEAGNILFNANCPEGTTLALSCDPTGLCLKK